MSQIERKFATILATDCVSFSKHMTENEEGTLSSLNSCRSIIDEYIEQHGGRIFHTAGDSVVWVPDEQVMFTGDIVEKHSACYCGDGYFGDWGKTLNNLKAYDPQSLAPGRGDALVGRHAVNEAIELTREFVNNTYRPIAQVAARNGTLKDAWDACRDVCDPKFKEYAIY